MSETRTVLEHLLDSRDALLLEVSRLTMAINELDSVIGRIGGDELRSRLTGPDGAQTSALAAAGSPRVGRRFAETISPPVEGEGDGASYGVVGGRDRGGAAGKPSAPNRRPSAAAVTTSRARATSGSLPDAPIRTARTTASAGSGDGHKSIRVHVLEMLAADARDFGLAEIIERIHGYGIAAHDDAVRSITIKLMKDGKVERVGRGQYRLARRSAGARRSPGEVSGAAEPTGADVVQALGAAPADGGGDGSPTSADIAATTSAPHSFDRSVPADATAAPGASSAEASSAETPSAETPSAETPSAETSAVEAPADTRTAETPTAETPTAETLTAEDPPARSQSYPPPLNLAQPWDAGR